LKYEKLTAVSFRFACTNPTLTCIKAYRQSLLIDLTNSQGNRTMSALHQLRKSALHARQAELIARLAAIEQTLDAPQTSDWDDLAIAREDDEVLEATGLSGQQELRQIAAALERMDQGTYGICARCGGVIGDDRLNVLPYTPVCRACAT
jgi:RNA polymerase-binding transcription factor DksA